MSLPAELEPLPFLSWYFHHVFSKEAAHIFHKI